MIRSLRRAHWRWMVILAITLPLLRDALAVVAHKLSDWVAGRVVTHAAIVLVNRVIFTTRGKVVSRIDTY